MRQDQTTPKTDADRADRMKKAGRDREADRRPAADGDPDRTREIVGAAMTRAAPVTAEAINARRASEPLLRRGEIREIDVEKRTVEISFSSETPVERWFGDEVLDHAPGAMNVERMESGAPLLMNHDHRDQVGVIVSARVDGDKVGRALVRFGKSARADEMMQDVIDGIRTNISVGYAIDKIEITPRKGLADLVRVTAWTPYEISIVSVPADASVGVGRAAAGAGNPPEDTAAAPGDGGAPEELTPSGAARAQSEDHDMKTKILRAANGDLVRAEVDENDEIIKVIEVLERAGADIEAATRAGEGREQGRVTAIMDLGRQYGAVDLAAKFVQEQKSPDEFQRALLDHVSAQRGNRPLAAGGDENIGLSPDEVRNYSFLNVIRALVNPHDRRAQEDAAFEIEASQAAAQRSNRQPVGLFIPPDVMRRALNTSTSGAASGDTGGFSVATELMSQSFVDMLRNRTVAMQLGRPMGGLVGNLDIPRQVGGATGYWIGEGDDAIEGDVELDQISMSPKTVAAYSELSRKLMQQSSLDVEALVRSDLATALALAIDKAFFYGSGSANQPRGLKNMVGINAVDFGGTLSGGGVALPTYAEMVQMETEISADNADVNSMAYVVNARMRGHLKTTEKFAGTTGSPVWEPANTVNGYRGEVTNQIATGDVFFGNYADALIGMWGGLDMTIDTSTHSKSGAKRIVLFQDADFVFRRVESFCYGVDAS
jgi:HK97 family phage major capsid protein/HK97 family phage prohead protease